MTNSRRILILGGTSWLGGTMARIAHSQGYDVTCLARGESGDVPDGVRLVRTDRREPGAYDAVADQDWDAVFDVSWQPELVRSALEALAPRAQRWIYVSSVSVYADHSVVGADESSPTHEAWTGTGEVGWDDYGAAKVACEEACASSVPADRLLIARAGLIVGYGDRSDRFGYWPARLADIQSPDAVVLVPPLDTTVQVIDVEDLAGWLVSTVETGASGVVNAVGEVISFEQVIGECAAATGQDPTFAAPDQEWLLAQGVEPWAGPESLPLWLPVPEYAGMLAHRGDAARKAGLEMRPLADTVRASLAWEKELGLRRERKAGLSPEREVALLRSLLGDAVT